MTTEELLNELLNNQKSMQEELLKLKAEKPEPVSEPIDRENIVYRAHKIEQDKLNADKLEIERKAENKARLLDFQRNIESGLSESSKSLLEKINSLGLDEYEKIKNIDAIVLKDGFEKDGIKDNVSSLHKKLVDKFFFDDGETTNTFKMSEIEYGQLKQALEIAKEKYSAIEDKEKTRLIIESRKNEVKKDKLHKLPNNAIDFINYVKSGMIKVYK